MSGEHLFVGVYLVNTVDCFGWGSFSGPENKSLLEETTAADESV